MSLLKSHEQPFHRFRIEAKKIANIVPHPHRFTVKVNKLALAKFLLKELVHYRGNLEVVKSRPCVYGVFSGPVGGFLPRDHLCVGCLRCTTQYPDVVQILRNPKRNLQGDAWFTADYIDTIVYEAEHGRVPIKGAGFRGRFGGDGWDAMWTDMSEIVRPTRDGIHGREYISMEVDLGMKPSFLTFNEKQQSVGEVPETLTIPIPMLFDAPPASVELNTVLCRILNETAIRLKTFVILPLNALIKNSLKGEHIIPLISPQDYASFRSLGFEPIMLELAGWDESFYKKMKSVYPRSMLIVRMGYEAKSLLSAFRAGVRIFHLTASYHGKGEGGRFVLDLIREAHQEFCKASCRGEVTIIGSGGVIAAEHLAKAIICGLDAVAIDTPVMAALQGRFSGHCETRQQSTFNLPDKLTEAWGVQRLMNLTASWHDQLLEILGAMGLREVRRLRGEMGRAMFQKDLEQEAFAGISGYESR